MEIESRKSVFRALDAAINRASEGLRVLEDYQRMLVQDPKTTKQLKFLRHRFIDAITGISMTERLAARDSEGDVGKSAELQSEYSRSDTKDIQEANFSRVQQALRSAEEFSKLVCEGVAKRIEEIRFHTYSLQKQVAAVENSMRTPIKQTGVQPLRSTLYVLSDGCVGEQEFEIRIAKLLKAGVKLLQLRDKKLDAEGLLRRGKILHRLTRRHEAAWIMNDRVDLALAAQADGVHVGQEDLPLHEVQKLVQGKMWIGVSTHNMAQVEAAVLGGADYIGVGPTFPSRTKSFDSFAGLEFIQQVAKSVTLPAFAIGGIQPENCLKVVQNGLRQFAIQNAIIESDDPAEVVNAFETAVLKSVDLS